MKRAEIDVVRHALRCLAAAGWLLGAASQPGCRGHASPEDCSRMVEHYLDLAVRESPGGERMPPAQAAAVRDVERGLKRAEPAYREVLERCESIERSAVGCAVSAPSTAAWEDCIRGPAPPKRD